MAYDVIKTVKGRQYRYLQESYRDGGKVKTRSIYLGPVDAVNRRREGNNSTPIQRSPSPTKDSLDETMKEALDKAFEDVPQVFVTQESKSSSIPKRPNKVITTNKEPLSFKSKLNLGKLGISENALKYKYATLQRRLIGKGIPLDALKPITFKHGGTEVSTKSKISGISVTLPRFKKGQSSRFRREAHKAFAQSAIDAWESTKPDELEKLSLQFEGSFQKTKRCVSSYIMNGIDRNRFFKCLAFRYWGEVSQFKNFHTSPKHLGIVDFDRKTSWKDEAAAIYACIQQRGLKPFWEDFGKEYISAEKGYRAALKKCRNLHPLNPRRRAASRKRKQAAARLRGQVEMMKKIRMVEDLLL